MRKKFLRILVITMIVWSLIIVHSNNILIFAIENTEKAFTIKYHSSDTAEASSQTTKVVLGVSTKTLTSTELGFTQSGKVVKGWKAYRESDKSWAVTDGKQMTWAKELPEGYDYYMYWDGTNCANTGVEGDIVHFYAIWVNNIFTVEYYLNDDATKPSTKTTTVNIGTDTAILTTKELGFSMKNKVFIGWKVYRTLDDSWRFTNGEQSIWAKEKPEGYDYMLYAEGNVISRTSTPETVVKLYAQWIEGNLDVTNPIFGANGNDKVDDTTAIQRALNMAKTTNDKITVNIPKGTYYLSNTLGIYSNTDLVLDKDAVIVRSNDANTMLISKSLTEGVGGYEHAQNINVIGGTWDGNVTSMDSTGGTNVIDIMSFDNASNIVIKDTTIKECCGYHFIEFIGVKDSKISNVKFLDYIKPSTIKNWSKEEAASEVAEAVQLDFDDVGTICDNVTVENCTFTNCRAGVGSHHSKYKSKNINILNNKFNNIERCSINLNIFDNVTIKGNSTENAERFIASEGSTNIIAKNNTANNIKENVVYFANSTGKISNNTFTNIKGTTAMNMQNSVVSILNNNISDVANNAIGFNKGNGSEVIGNKITNINKDGIVIKSIDGITISDNNIINAKSSAIALSDSKNVNVIKNTLIDYAQMGIYCDNITAEIQENTFDYDKVKGQFGIWTTNTCNLKIVKNDISKLEKDAINANTGIFEIVDNTIYDCDRYGIRIQSGKVNIKSNTIIRNATLDINVCNNEGKVVEGEISNNTIGEKGIYADKNIKQTNNITRKNIIGDVNQDGVVNSQDAVQILKYVAHNIQLNEDELLAADTDRSGKVNAQDAVQILKYVAHNISGF